MTENQPKLAAFYSSVQGKLVRRFGTETNIGARIDIERDDKGHVTRRKVIWNEDQIVAISEVEMAMHRRSYTNAVRRGELTERTRSEWEAQLSAAPPEKPDEPEENSEEAETLDDGDAEGPSQQERKTSTRKRRKRSQEG